MNDVKLMGRLGADPELMFGPSGTEICHFRLATDDSYRNSNGDLVRNTTWHRIVCFGKTASAVNANLKKGDQALISGRISYDTRDSTTFTNSSGEPARFTYTSIRAARVIFGAKARPKNSTQGQEDPGQEDLPDNIFDESSVPNESDAVPATSDDDE